MNGGLSVYIPQTLQFTLVYNETLNRMDVVPDRALYDFCRRSRKRDGALVKPSSPPPPTVYSPSIEHPRIFLYISS